MPTGTSQKPELPDTAPVRKLVEESAAHAMASWQAAAKALTLCAEKYPEIWEEMANLTLGQFQAWQAVEEVGHNIVSYDEPIPYQIAEPYRRLPEPSK